LRIEIRQLKQSRKYWGVDKAARAKQKALKIGIRQMKQSRKHWGVDQSGGWSKARSIED
jgi:hypothetical protein